MKSIKLWCTLVLIMMLLPTADGFSCTAVMAAKNGMVLAGHNEDWNNPYARINFMPAAAGRFGCFYISWQDGWVLGGINDQGLFIHDNSVAATRWRADPAKQNFPGNPRLHILQTCATVPDVRKFFDTYNVPLLNELRFPVVDRSGASMVVEYAQGSVRFVTEKTWYQVSTNFLRTDYPGIEVPCWRFRLARQMLDSANELSVPLIRSILSATHQEGNYPTVYSGIYDLKAGLINVYDFHNFEETVVFNLAKELEKGDHAYWLSSLFPKNDLKNSYIKMYVEKHGIKLQPPHFIYFKILFLGCAIIFISVIAVKILYLIFRFLFKSKKINYPASYKDSAPLEKAAHYVGIVVSIFGLIFAYAFWKYTSVVNYGLPCWNAPSLTKIEQLLLLVPIIMGICASAQILFTILAWLKSYWSLKMRWHYTLVTIVAGLVVGLLIYWDLLKFCIGHR